MKGKEPLRSTPAEVQKAKCLRSRGAARIRLPEETRSVCSGPLSPSHLRRRRDCVGYGGYVHAYKRRG